MLNEIQRWVLSHPNSLVYLDIEHHLYPEDEAPVVQAFQQHLGLGLGTDLALILPPRQCAGDTTPGGSCGGAPGTWGEGCPCYADSSCSGAQAGRCVNNGGMTDVLNVGARTLLDHGVRVIVRTWLARARAVLDEQEDSAAADDTCVFRPEGEYWTLACRGKTARLRDTKGLHYIARLLAQPGCDLHVRDLATMNQQSESGNGSEPRYAEGDLGVILDARATAQYKGRLAEARRELDEATAAGDLGQAARLQHEMQTITEQLAAAYGLGGRPRMAGDPAERVRKAVTNQIRRALERIRTAHPELGRHLTNALRTGFVCAYRPEHPVAWRL